MGSTIVSEEGAVLGTVLGSVVFSRTLCAFAALPAKLPVPVARLRFDVAKTKHNDGKVVI